MSTGAKPDNRSFRVTIGLFVVVSASLALIRLIEPSLMTVGPSWRNDYSLALQNDPEWFHFIQD